VKRTPWILTVLTALLLTAAATASYFKAVEPDPSWSAVWVKLADVARSRSAGAILLVTVAVIALQVLRESIVVYQWRKDRVQRVLGKVVKHLLDNDVKLNRCSLFQAVRGWRAFSQLFWRMLWFQDDKGPILRELVRINPLGHYLIVYARPAGAPNDRSCACFRVYRTRPTASEGVAGRVWDSDEYSVRSASKVVEGRLRNCRSFDKYHENDPLRRFAAETNLQRASQLRARSRVASHYHGTVIAAGDGSRKWGVLLVDSFKTACPFPASVRQGDKGSMFCARFNGYAETLSTMLT